MSICKTTLLLAALALTTHSLAQEAGRQLHMELTFADSPLNPGAEYRLEDGSLVAISMLRFYLSAIRLKRGQDVVWSEADSYHLIDASKPETLDITLDCGEKKYDNLEITLGIDSTTNVSGAMGGDLDPVLGMYWAWQSGYISLKVEGSCSNVPSKDHIFRLHLGGYMPPNACARVIRLPIDRKGDIRVTIDLARLLNKTDLSRQFNVVEPGRVAAELMSKATQIFSIKE